MDILEQLIKSLEDTKTELEKAASKAPSSSPVVGIPAAQVKDTKIKNLQSQIDSGTYKPDSKKIADKMLKEEMLSCGENGQWDIKKWNMEKRCWEGYEPTPGKKAYSDDSCRPIKKEEAEVAPKGSNNKKTFEESFAKSEELADNEFEITEWDNGDIDIAAGQAVPEDDFNFLCKSVCEKADCEEMDKKEWSPKAEHKSEKGGLTAAGRESYNNATGGNLKAPQPKGGPRKKSFCARNAGQIKMHNIDCKADPDKRACKARRRWKC